MARKTIHRKKSQGHQLDRRPAAPTKTPIKVNEVEKWVCGFDGEVSQGVDSSLALVRSGVNGHKVRILDIHTGVQRSEHACEDGTKIRAISWGQLPPLRDQSKKNKNKSGNSATTGTSQVVIILGLQSGQIQLFSPARNAIVKVLEAGSGGHETSVVDVKSFGDDGQLFSLDQDGVVIQWDANVGKAVRVLKTGISEAQRLLVSSDGQRVVVASHKIELWDLAKKSKVQAWPGHTASITTLLWAADETALVSAAENDRHVQVWDASPTAVDSAGAAAARARAVLAIDSDVAHADVSLDGSVLAVGQDGILSLWYQVAVAHRGEALKRSEGIGHKADGIVKIVSSADENQHIAILLARFSRVSGDEGNVNIVRGSSLKPLFETLSLADVDGQFESEVVLAREPQGNLLVQGGRTDAEKKMAAQQQTYSEANATITNPALEAARKSQKAADEAISAQGTPSLADRIKELSTDAAATATANAKDAKDSGLKHKTIAEEPKLQAGTLVRVLVQSLHTDDQALLDSVIKNSARTSVVRETVMGLPTSYVVLFLQQLFSRYQTSPGRAMHLLPWIRNVFAIHSGYLTSIPNLVPQLSGFYQGIQTRLETHQRLLKLNGRLEIANIQIRARSMFEQEKKKDDIKVAHMKPLSVYRESEDEEEEDAAMDQDENVPAWQAEESTDDEELSGAESQDDDQWSDSDSDDNGEADSDESEDDGASGSEDGSDEPSSDDNSDDDGDDLEEYE